MKTLIPYGLPFAASAWIIHPSGLVLSVSRKHDEEDLGLPGGKLDPGESFEEAVKRETKEETNLDITDVRPVFGDACGTPGVHNVHWCLTFVCKAVGDVRRMEKGKVLWVDPERLVMRPNGEYNSFGLYNRSVQKAVSSLGHEISFFHSNLLIRPEFRNENN